MTHSIVDPTIYEMQSVIHHKYGMQWWLPHLEARPFIQYQSEGQIYIDRLPDVNYCSNTAEARYEKRKFDAEQYKKYINWYTTNGHWGDSMSIPSDDERWQTEIPLIGHVFKKSFASYDINDYLNGKHWNYVWHRQFHINVHHLIEATDLLYLDQIQRRQIDDSMTLYSGRTLSFADWETLAEMEIRKHNSLGNYWKGIAFIKF